MCVVTNKLLHIPEDIKRFSSTVNFWCFPFERGAKKYNSRSSNCKYIEVTVAKAEARRELLTVNPSTGPLEGKNQPFSADFDRDSYCILQKCYKIHAFEVPSKLLSRNVTLFLQVIASSGKDARKLAKEQVDPSKADKLNEGILVGSCKNMKVTELSQAEIEDIA